jgi:cobalt-zinc-cadmium resistance protein CzcA
MSFALLGALLCSLTLLPVLCSYFLTNRVHEPRLFVFEWIQRTYGASLGWCLRNRALTVILVLIVFGGSLLLIPSIGAEFMPHLDEGALWVRATTPYTISFEEASKLCPSNTRHPVGLSTGNDRSQRARPPGRRNRSDRLFQQ